MITVEANLRIPSFTARSAGQPDRKIDNSNVRFIKRITVDAIPKAGDSVTLSTRSGEPFDATVTRADWDEGKELFVVSCTYARRSITVDEHQALVSDPDWVTRELP